MSKIEKTLELNITHEILALADSFWWFVQPITLKRYWRPHWRFPLLQHPKSYATGLPINLEGKPGGGYDVCIHSPSNFQGGSPRLLFMQFKAGSEQPFQVNSKSLFYGNNTKPNIHLEFDINSNKARNQHRLLKSLASKAGNKNAIVYVFPRIVNKEQLARNIGGLLKVTSFLSVEEIDQKAALKGINIDDGNPHKFRTCYRDYNKNEINLLLLILGKPDNPGGFLGEIFAIRMYRALNTLGQAQLTKFPIARLNMIDAMIRHVFNLANYFSVSYDNLIVPFKKFPSFIKRLEQGNRLQDMPPAYPEGQEENRFSLEFFQEIIATLSLYFEWVESSRGVDFSRIPNPPSKYSIPLMNEEIRFTLNDEVVNPEDFDDFTYTVI